MALRWIKKHPSELKIFVANRVNEIQEKSHEDYWNYVPSEQNPADIASRPASCNEYRTKFWLEGPEWLKEPSENWPNWLCEPEAEIEKLISAEEKPMKVEDDVYLIHILTANPLKRTNFNISTDVIETYSSFDKIINVIAWVKRASTIFRDRKNHIAKDFGTGPLTPFERENALLIAVKWEQQKHLANEFKSIYKKDMSIRDRLYRGLSLFIDEHEGFIRINGRIRNESLSRNYKYTLLLPPEATLTKRLMLKAHEVTLHGGAQQMLQYTRQRFWIPKARQMAKGIISSCSVCKRHDFRSSEQQMAPLPKTRTTPGKVFERVGIDFCGPVLMKSKPGRTNVTYKSYICVFVCLSTRAIHLELTTELTTNAFIGALRRFVARRGRVNEIVSDHGTNFVGAYNEISRMKQYLKDISNYNYAPEFNLIWRFTTERASHHGGIFEAAVKSAKRHLIRCIGNQMLTYEEYNTFLCQVECCLNSRPISKLTDDANDLRTLTPGHFLVGEQLNSFPEGMDLRNISQNRLIRWQLVQQLYQQFWKKWHDEYLHTLINRPKWNKEHRNFQINDIVIVKEDNLAPTRWKLGRIIQVKRGVDGLVRSVEIRTSTGTINRPIVKLALLLEGDESNESPNDSEIPSASSSNETLQVSSGAGCSHWNRS